MAIKVWRKVGAHDVASSSGSCKTKMLRRCDVDLRKQNTYYSGLPVLFIDRPYNQFRLASTGLFAPPLPSPSLPRLVGDYPALANILDPGLAQQNRGTEQNASSFPLTAML
jgi:hypothetical protein